MSYSALEYTDMIIAYGRAGENIREAARLYAEQFPGRRHPDKNVILRCVQRARETGILMPDQHTTGAPDRHTVNDAERILAAIEENPQDSVRCLANTLGLSRRFVHRTLRENGLHPFHFQRVQQLLPRDYQPRVNFCEGFLAQCRSDNNFPDRILWTDEATFTPNGVFNSHNYLLWADENPRAIRQQCFQYRWSVNVWAGVMNNKVIGPYILPPRLTGDAYCNFLQHKLPELLEDIPVREKRRLIFQHDGAPAHFSRQAREILNRKFPDKWIGRGGPIIWPARSPDLNVLDFFVWGHIKSLVEAERGGTEGEMREAIFAAFRTITPEMTHRATRNVVRRAELCLQQAGRNFEQLLH